MVTIRTPAGQRITPNWNVQELVNAIASATGATNFGTYLGHSPSAERSTDSFSIVPMPRSNHVLGDDIAEFCLNGTITLPDGSVASVWDYYAIRYIIWRQRINWNDGGGWALMADRGGDTQNHLDHDHIATNEIPRPSSLPLPAAPITGGNEVLIVNVKNTGIFLLRGNDVAHLQTPDHVFEWVGVGVPYQDRKEMSREVFTAYTGWGSVQGAFGSGLAFGEDPEVEAQITQEYQNTLEEVRAKIDAVYDDYVKSLQVQ